MFFFIELFKIIKTEECYPLPRCVNKKGELPKKPEIPAIPEAEKPGTVSHLFRSCLHLFSYPKTKVSFLK
jgi:hypothetical protein